MNTLEAAYAQYLEEQKAAGNVVWFAYEAITLKLAPKTTYTADFAVQKPDGEVVIVETKGFMRDDAWVKLKTAAALFPFRFFLVRKKTKKAGSGWDTKEVV